MCFGICPCDVWTQDSPEGKKCVPYADDGGDAWNNVKCAEVVRNPDQPGDECSAEGMGLSGIDTCDKGSMCWEVNPETGKGTCVAFCQGSTEDPVCAEPGKVCQIFNEGVLILCLPET